MNSFRKYFHSLVIINLISIQFLTAQNINPGSDIIYDESEVTIMQISMANTDKSMLLSGDTKPDEEYFHMNLRFKSSKIDTILPDIGIRLRGDTSFDNPKKSFKIKFKEFDGKKFRGYKKFNLKAQKNDPSQIREFITLRTYRNAGVPAARANHSKIYINGEYMGLYLNIEQIDDEFIMTRFGNDSGNIYKCHNGSSMENDGQIYNNEIFELETNKKTNDRSILANFIQVLNNTSDENFKNEIEKVLNVESVIKFFAVEALTGHWGSYSYYKNNIYLYENPYNGLIEVIPYDADNTFGIDFTGNDWATRDITNWAKNDESRPLNKRIMAVNEYYLKYIDEINNLLENTFNEDKLYPQFDFYKDNLAIAVSVDTYYPLAYGFTYQNYTDSFDKIVAEHATYGLKPYVKTRVEKAISQINPVKSQINILANNFKVFPNPSNGKSVNLSFGQEIINDSEIKIFNSNGQQIDFNSETKNGKIKLTFNHKLITGLYIINYKNISQRFMVR